MMTTSNSIYLDGKNVVLKTLEENDVSQRYVDWLNDTDVNQFLDIRHFHHDLKSVTEYVLSYKDCRNMLLIGIFNKANVLHIGNVTFSSIDWLNKSGTIGIAIGDKACWGKGYATEVLNMSIDIAFNKLGLHRLEAGVSVKNVSSQKLFEKVGFKKEGIRKESGKFGDDFVDSILYGLVNGNNK